ncbi:hypothetical protein [Rhizobium ruizarguesonis]|uniref:Uncharacterized protein n=1 Tax=Rhizobium ruizarguesonis TaxID=2081791 RepID=A0AAE4YUQ7_9HYPH|nr:hypothetical protein [Rhizobium ruizarguesonis]NEI50137.1 hypothetical protein [Rhizobium ruizarguesonis]TAW15850.1 hypothetical protein ELI25_08370 [Rhizobium ruizarguesonis]TAZ51380.1 hypothetical protein ELH76_09440 [Rhizobium ruizarguesonis]TBC98691.1 hypothetical protein ELH25_08215 [Rhizobium ruizarguesonis]TBD15528.1 hypothetical protein ELH24_08210 [Rhizobium ruizarguesonis]
MIVDQKNNTYHRLESDLESKAMEIFLAMPDTDWVKAQDGPHYYVVEGILHKTIIDLVRYLLDGSREFVSIKAEGEAAREEEAKMKLLNNQLPKDSRDRFLVMTDEQIRKARVNASRHILRSRELATDVRTARVHEALLEMGGRARVWEISERLTDLTCAQVVTATWDMIAKGIAKHDHPAPERFLRSKGSWIRAVTKE